MFNENQFNAAVVAKGENNSDAARVMGMNPTTLSRKKSGISDFTRLEIEAFCEHYGVSPTSIFFATYSA